MVVPDAGNWGNSLSASAAVEAPPEVPHREADAGEQGATDSPVPVTEAQPKADESGVYREDWLGTQSPDAVTLQLVAVSRESSLRRFLNQHQLSAPTAYFHTQRNGKDWYVVVHGVYSDRTAAQAAIPALPEAIRQGRPWPRTFASVQTDIQAEAAP
jgi:DamX protein